MTIPKKEYLELKEQVKELKKQLKIFEKSYDRLMKNQGCPKGHHEALRALGAAEILIKLNKKDVT